MKEKEIVYENVMFEQKEVRKLEISPVNSKSSNQVLNTENIKTIFTSMESAEKKNTPSRSRGQKLYTFKNEGYLSR